MITGKEWDEVNTLLSFLHASDVVTLVEQKYKPFGNTAPSTLLAQQIALVEKSLNRTAGARHKE